MTKTRTHAIQIADLESKPATRDCAWAFAFPMTSHHQWPHEGAFVAGPAKNRLWAALRRQMQGPWRRAAERRGRARRSLAIQAQDFSDLFRILSLPASRTDGTAVFAIGRGASCN